MLFAPDPPAPAVAASAEEKAEQERLSKQLLSQLRAGLDAARAGADMSAASIDLTSLRTLTRTQIASSLGRPTTCDNAPYCETSAAWVYDFSAPGKAGPQLLILFDAHGHCATARWQQVP
ncbi:MAG TPA: hypothetical protein VEC57_17970 [Candidatus Limnocylindrales bacterium]|nr:hypothetical protein [Candidatus Limnocylindrales bacterium]